MLPAPLLPCAEIARRPTLYMDAFVDTFFLIEIVLNFFTGIYVAGEYCDDLYFVSRRYFLQGFFFDLLTSIPASYFEVEHSLAAPPLSLSPPLPPSLPPSFHPSFLPSK